MHWNKKERSGYFCLPTKVTGACDSHKNPVYNSASSYIKKILNKHVYIVYTIILWNTITLHM